MMTNLLPIAELTTLLRATMTYTPETGELSAERWNLYLAGNYPTMYDPITKIAIGQHRAAYVYMTGFLPRVVDHANRDTLDLRWRNLRCATHHSNLRNRSNSLCRLQILAQGLSPDREIPHRRRAQLLRRNRKIAEMQERIAAEHAADRAARAALLAEVHADLQAANAARLQRIYNLADKRQLRLLTNALAP